MPIQTPKGTFFHMPKAGGTWVSSVLQQHFGGEVIGVGGHLPSYAYPNLKRPYFGIIRDPFDFYPSFYCHCIRAGRQGGIAYWGETLEEEWLGKTRFRAFLYGLTHPWEVKEFEQGSLGVIFNVLDFEEASQQLHYSGQGFCSWLTSYMFGDEDTHGEVDPEWGLDETIQLPDLKEHLASVLGVDKVPEPRRDAVNSSARVVTEFDGKPYPEWYGPEEKGWVMEADGWLIDEFKL